MGIVLYQWAYNEKHPYETLPGGKISRIKGGLISELFFLGSTQCLFLGIFVQKLFFIQKAVDLSSKSLLALTKQVSTCFEDFMNIS